MRDARLIAGPTLKCADSGFAPVTGVMLVTLGGPADEHSAIWLRQSPRPTSFTSMANVKNRRRGATRISSKNQITIPADTLRASGLKIGDRVIAHADGPGRVILEREQDVLAQFAGAMTGAYAPDELENLRAEWD